MSDTTPRGHKFTAEIWPRNPAPGYGAALLLPERAVIWAPDKATADAEAAKLAKPDQVAYVSGHCRYQCEPPCKTLATPADPFAGLPGDGR